MITKRILPIYSLYDVSKAAFAVRENAELRCIRPSMAVKKLNLDTFISTLDQVYSAETLHEKEKHFHRLTSVYGHIPTDDLIFHMLEANASQNSVDRVVSLLSLLKNEGRGPLARSTMQGIVNCLIFLRSVLAAQVEADGVCLFHHFHNEGIREKQTVEYSNNTCTHATNNNNNNNALDETTSMCFHREGTVSTLPGLTNQVRSLWKDAIHLAQDATSILTVCLEAVRCLSIAGDTAGLNQICFDYIPSSCESHRVGGMGAFTTFSCADELLAAALYGYRKAADLFAIHELCKKYAILPKHSSFKDTSTAPLPPLTFPKAALYYTEALLALGDFAEATQTLQILQEFPLYTESDTGALTLEDLVHQHTVLKTKTWEESLALMTTTKENTKERYKMATIQDDILDRRLAMIVSSTFELIEARRDNLDNSIVIQIIHHINTVTERGNMMGVAGPETTHALFSSLEHLLYDAVSPCTKDVVDQKEVEERVRKALERFKSSRYSTSSGNATFCTETPRCVNAVLSLLLRLCDMEAMEVYVRTLTERDTVSYIRGELYRDIWKLARAEGHGTFACMLRVHRKLIVP